MKKLAYIAVFLLLQYCVYGQKKVYVAQYLTKEPKIDGIEDSIWQNVPAASGFFQYSPNNGGPPAEKTVVKVGYTSKALFVFAYLFDRSGKIYDYLSQRDKTGQSDWFGIYLDTYKDAQVAYVFIVTAAGVQVDKKIIGTKEDYQWDAVWRSAVKRTDFGWTVEMKIPFSHLRFSRSPEQIWGVNFVRNIQRNKELDVWNYMDVKQNEIISQFGLLRGIKDIKYSMRLDLFPYASAYLENNASNIGKYYNGGMDLKLGLSRSFTLDMMLIPDFGEVMSDEPVLNLSPYETYYMERRQFFTEGTEIFNLGGIFYSKRIGGKPVHYDDVQYLLKPNEIVLRNPLEVQILNATKLSGKTRNNLGIGFLNAITSTTYATVKDTITGKERKIITDPQTNYNVFAVKKDFPNSSYIGFCNTNKFVLVGRHYLANVTAFEGAFRDKTKTFRVFFRTAASANFFDLNYSPQLGYMYAFSFGKVRGNFKFSGSRTLYSDTYDPNDLGYLKQNNIVNNNFSVSYDIFRPFWIIRRWTTRFTVLHQTLFRPQKYIGTQLKFDFYGTLKNLTSVGMRLNFTPDQVYNYFEPRQEDFVYIEYPKQNYSFWLSTDYSKHFAIDVQTGFYFPYANKSQQTGGWLLLSPRLRIGDHVLFVYSVKGNIDVNNYGYVGASSFEDSVFFGKRNIRTLENILNLDLAFSAHSYLTMRMRHYWSLVNYVDYFALLRDGRLVHLNFPYHYVEDQDKNFNSLNVDIVYTWQFLPGSELSVIYKKQLTLLTSELITDFWQNFYSFYRNAPNYETFTIKIVIYI